MFENNNVVSFIFTFLPALIYSIIVYVTAPPFTIRWRIASLFFSMGVLSTILVNAVHYMFPNWDYPMSSNVILALFCTAFIKVGFLEEASKFSMFKLTEWYRNKTHVDHPSAIMFYAMSISCGFAVSENILYAQIYGGEVLFIRSFSSVLVHMICGLMMGYFVALGRIDHDSPKNNLSLAHPRVRMISHTIAGIMCASFYHGLYDFNIFVNGDAGVDKSFTIIGIGLAVTYVMSAHLFRYFKQS
jgi:RsiW-degrading membrane proteinase PrsW (M82 family)